MAKKFVDAEEAARMLGISVSELGEMRDRHEVFPVRDGGQWKYKFDEMERLVADRAAGGGDHVDYADNDNLDSILLSEVELGHSGVGPSSTIIGKGNEPSPESDMKLADPKSIGPPSLSQLPDSPSELPDMGSDVQLSSPAELAKAGSSLSKKFDELDTLDLELPPALSSSGVVMDPGKLSPKPSDSGLLAIDDKLSLGEEPRSSLSGSSSKRRAAGSAIDLTGADDDDLVLGSGSSGSDLTHSAGGDSGISLIDPSDSGLALDDDALEMKTGSPSSKTSLNLGGGDDDLILLEEEADPNIATQLKADDDFLLTPTDDGGGQDSDSGSQVIALDADSEFDDASATMVGGRLGGGGLLESGMTDDFGGGLGAAGAPALGLAPGGVPLAAPQPAAMLELPEVKEAPFGAVTVVFLLLCVTFLGVAGMMMFDLMRNMWSWDSAYHVNSSLMDGILEMVGSK